MVSGSSGGATGGSEKLAHTAAGGASNHPPDAATTTQAGADGSLVGRVDDLAAVAALVGGAADGPLALVLEGEAGIGKTTVWQQVVDRATAGGLSVLSCRAVQAEAKLAYVSLADLLTPVADAVLPRLPEPQQEALEVALLRAAPSPGGVDARAVGAGVHSVLAGLAASSPVVVAIDDVQWLDRASAAALAFALRRLQDRPVAIALTVRTDTAAAADPLGLAHALGARVQRRRLGPLSLAALHQLLGQRLGAALPRPTLQRIAQASAGNPLFALELTRALLAADVRPGPADALPVPETLTALVAERVAGLSPLSRQALLAAASLSAPTTAVIEQAVGNESTVALEEAAAAEVISLAGQRVRFSHPLFGSAVYTAASPAQRRRLHRRLARVAGDVEEQARHTALGVRGHDEQAAALLDAAAAHAQARGAPGVAGELLEWAARLTPAGDVATVHARLIGAAEHFYRAGDLQYARGLLEGLLEQVSEGAPRGRALRLLGEIRYNENSFAEAVSLLTRALDDAAAPDVAVDILLGLAFAHFSVGNVAQALSAARQAVQQAQLLGEGPLLGEALAVEANVAFFAGHGLDTDTVQRALTLEDRSRTVQLLVRPSLIDALFALYGGRLSEAAAKLRAVRDWAVERGEDSDCMLLTWLSRVEIFRGDFTAAEGIAEEALTLAAQTRSNTIRGAALLVRGKARAFRGEVAPARADLQHSDALLAQVGWEAVRAWNRWTLGFLELSLQDHAAAEHAFAPDVAAVEAAGVAEPFAVNFLPDAIEALIDHGQVDRAERLLDMFEGPARQLGRTAALLGATRCRALLLAARGDLAGATDAAQESLEWAATIEMPIERGRSLLVHGQLQRRARHKQAARDALEQALAIFAQHDAALWADRARAELRRVAHRSPPGQLTATEQRVAQLAATGRTNREIARALFISPKTVEANLARIYRKLAIRSRAELGRVMAETARR